MSATSPPPTTLGVPPASEADQETATSCRLRPRHPEEFHSSSWDSATNRPVVDGKLEDPSTGAVRPAGPWYRSGPPSVDLVVSNLYPGGYAVVRACRSLPMRTYLCHVMGVVDRRKLGVDTIVATAYAIRVVLVHEFEGGVDEWREAADEMVDGYQPRWRAGQEHD